MSKGLFFALALLLFLIAPLFYLSFPLSLLAFDSTYYQWVQAELKVLPGEDVARLDTSLVRYFLWGSELPADIRTLFQQKELLHLQDIAKLLHLLLLATIIISSCFLVLISLLILLFPLKAKKIFPLSLLFSFATYLVGGTLFALLFDQAFLGFHLLIFQNDFWILGENYLLYRLFPPAFFQFSAVPLFALSALLLLLSYLLSVLLGPFLKERKPPPGSCIAKA